MLSRAREVYGILFLLPVVLIILLGLSLQEKFGAPTANVYPVQLVVVNANDADTSGIGRAVSELLAAEEERGRLVVRQASSRDTAVELILGGEAQYGLVIPKYTLLDASVAPAADGGRARVWELLPGERQAVNKAAEAVLLPYVEELSWQQAGRHAIGPKYDPAWTTIVSLPLPQSVPANGASSYTAMQYYAAAMLVMFMLYTGMMLSASLQEQRVSKTMARLLTHPVTWRAALGGKVLAYALLALLQAAAVIGFTYVACGVSWGDRLEWVAAACGLYALITVSLAVVLTAVCRTEQLSSTVFQMVIIASTLVSGGFIPTLPAAIASLGEYTFSFWTMQSLLHLMLGNAELAGEAMTISAMWAVAAAVTAIFVHRKAGFDA